FMMSLALVLGLFIKPVLYPFALIHFLMLLIYALAVKIKWKKVIMASLLPIICIVAYSYGNQLRTGKFHFSSIQSFNAIFYYHHYFADKTSMKEADAWIAEERKQIAALPHFKDRYEQANQR